MSSGQERTIVDNEVFNVLHSLTNKLEGLAAYNKYEKDSGATKALWGQLRQQDEQMVRQLLAQLEQLVQQGRLKAK